MVTLWTFNHMSCEWTLRLKKIRRLDQIHKKKTTIKNATEKENELNNLLLKSMHKKIYGMYIV